MRNVTRMAGECCPVDQATVSTFIPLPSYSARISRKEARTACRRAMQQGTNVEILLCRLHDSQIRSEQDPKAYGKKSTLSTKSCHCMLCDAQGVFIGATQQISTSPNSHVTGYVRRAVVSHKMVADTACGATPRLRPIQWLWKWSCAIALVPKCCAKVSIVGIQQCCA